VSPKVLVLIGLAVSFAGDRCLAAAPRDDPLLSPGGATAREAMRVLKTECFACHNAEKKKGGLVLMSRERLIEGGDDGVVVVPGKPESSLLAKVVLQEADPHMPPKKQLTDAQIRTLREWIKGGLVWNAAALAAEDAIVPIELAALPASYQPVLAIALSPDGKKLAVGRGGLVVVHDVSQTNFPVLAQLEAHRDAVQGLAWSKDGRWLASGAFRRIVLWNGESFKLEREWTNGLIGRVSVVKFSPEADKLALAEGVVGQSGFVRMFSVADGKLVDSWRAHEDTIFDLDFSRDGKQLVTASGDKLIKVWDLASKKELARLEGHAAQILGVAFNTNATEVVSGGADKQLTVWEIKTRQKVSSLGKHSSSVTAVARRWESHCRFYGRRRCVHLQESQSAHRTRKLIIRRRAQAGRGRRRFVMYSGDTRCEDYLRGKP
jgi:mono/diheme cytochrome c family protein